MRLVLASAIIASFCYAVVWHDQALPLPKGLSTPLAEFSEGRAWKHLEEIMKVSPRPVYSSNHELAFNYIKSALEEVARTSGGASVDVVEDRATGYYETPSGAFSGSLLTYSDIKSVAARVAPAGWGDDGNRHAMLVSVHVDSVPTAPGAGDNGQAIATALELARALVDGKPMTHAVIFLFCTAEEEGLIGAHAFITHHQWRKDVTAFVNIEAMGVGGKYIVTQVTPKGGWLLDAYARTAPRPYGFVTAQEIFDSGVIGADTDYRVFHEMGGYQGIELATVANTRAYHTPHDGIDAVAAGSIQFLGDNLLGLLREVAADAPALLPRAAAGGDAALGKKSVFWGFAGGKAMVVFNMGDAPAIYATAVVGVLSLAVLRWSVLPQRAPSWRLARGVLPAGVAGVVIVASSWALALVFTGLLAIPSGATNPLGLLGAPPLLLLMHAGGAMGGMVLIQWTGFQLIQSLLEPLEPHGLDDTRSVAQGVLYASTFACLVGLGAYLTYLRIATSMLPIMLAVAPALVAVVLQPPGTGERTAPPAPSVEEKAEEYAKYKAIVEKVHERRQLRQRQGHEDSDEEEDELMKELPQREEASASAVGVTYRAAVGAALAAAAVSSPSGGLFFQVMHGMCGRLMRHPGKGAVWKGDLLLGVASFWLVFTASVYLVPLIVARQKSGPGGRTALLLLLLWAALAGVSLSGLVEPFSAEQPRGVAAYHVHEVSTDTSYVVLASMAPGAGIHKEDLTPPSEDSEFHRYGSPMLMCVNKRLKTGLKHAKADGAIDLVSQLLRRNCRTMPGDIANHHAAAARAPSLAPATAADDNKVTAFRMTTGTSQRWALGVSPDQVAAFALSLGAPEDSDPVAGPFYIPWTTTRRGEAEWLPWHQVSHIAAGGWETRPQEFTLWARRQDLADFDGEVAMLRVDYNDKSWAWRWVTEGLPNSTALFHKKNQPLAYTSIVSTKWHVAE